jgi:hypothetical protein
LNDLHRNRDRCFFVALRLGYANSGTRLQLGNINPPAADCEVPEGLEMTGINRVAAGLSAILPVRHLTKSAKICAMASCNCCGTDAALRLKHVWETQGQGTAYLVTGMIGDER